MDPDEIVVSPESAQRCRAAFLKQHPEFVDCPENWQRLQIVLESENLPVTLRILGGVISKFRPSFRWVWSKPTPNLAIESGPEERRGQPQPAMPEQRRVPKVMNVLEYQGSV